MQFDGMHIEVDGSLENPMVAIAVLLWSFILSAAAVKLVSSYLRAKPESPVESKKRKAGVVMRLAFLFAITPITQLPIGRELYKAEAFLFGGLSVGSVGFWGGPPILPAWVLGALSIWAALRLGAKPRQDSSNSEMSHR